MIEVVVPELGETRTIQEGQGRYYWSRCAEVLFRKAGIISVTRNHGMSPEPCLKVVCRDVEGEWSEADAVPKVLEGPLSRRVLGDLGIVARRQEVEALLLDGSPSLVVHLPEIRVRRGDGSTCSFEPQGDDGKWGVRPFEVQFLEGEGWEGALFGRCVESECEGAVAVRKGATLVFGFAVLDILARWLAEPPLSERYGGFLRLMPHDRVLERVISLVVEHAQHCGVQPQLRVRRWPEAYTAALTVRHDYDRVAPMARVEALLDCYESLGVHASIGFLPYLLDQDVIGAFRGRGHEIQAHLSAATRTELREDLSLLRNVANYPVRGTTIHGGPRGQGFRGAIHFDWFEDAGLDYCENFGLRDTVPAPVLRLFDDIPDVSFLMGVPGHLSMDGSTRPADHRLAALQVAVPRSLREGDYVIVMNHPDVHQEELCALLAGLSLGRVWRPTTAEAVNWHLVTRYASRVRAAPRGYEVTFRDALPNEATVLVGARETTIAAGARTAFIPSGG